MWEEREASGLISPAAWVLSGGGLAFLPRPQQPCLLLQGAFWGLMAKLKEKVFSGKETSGLPFLECYFSFFSLDVVV